MANLAHRNPTEDVPERVLGPNTPLNDVEGP